VDTMPSYASNEICITWNAPLVFVVGYFNGSGVTAVPESYAEGIPKEIRLDQNYPNPFNPSTTISFSLPSRSVVSLKVFDLLGREVATIVQEDLSPGSYSRLWHADGLATGVYFCRLQAGSFTQTKKLVFLR
jgi:hypothetical protein